MKPRSKPTQISDTTQGQRPRAELGEPAQKKTRATKAKAETTTSEAPRILKQSLKVTTKASPATSKISPDEISRRAHEIWLREGQPQGRHLDHWYRAEEELRKERQG